MPINHIRVTAVDDPRLSDFRIVSDPVLMRERGLFVAEGRLAVERLLASRFRARALLLAGAAIDALEPSLAAHASGDPPLDVYLADSAQLRRITGFRFHRGCLALGERPRSGSEARAAGGAMAPPAPRRPLVVLEGVSDPDNVGSIFRNAAAFGASGVVLAPGCADPLYRKAIRTSMGTTLQLPFRVVTEWPGELRRIQKSGVRLVALTPAHRATDLETFVRRGAAEPVALLLGNEGEGISPAALDLCDERFRVDIEPAVDSLNVATAAAIALQRLRAAGPGGA